MTDDGGRPSLPLSVSRPQLSFALAPGQKSSLLPPPKQSQTPFPPWYVSPKILRLKRPFFGRLNCNCNRRRRERSKEDRPTERPSDHRPRRRASERAGCPPAQPRLKPLLAAADDKTSICRHTYSTKSERGSLASLFHFDSLAIKRALYPPSLARSPHIPVFFSFHFTVTVVPPPPSSLLSTGRGSHRVRALVVRAATVVRWLAGWRVVRWSSQTLS